MLTELDALIATLLTARPIFPMLRLDFVPVWTVIVIMVHISVFGRVFLRVRVVGSHFCHFVTSESN